MTTPLQSMTKARTMAGNLVIVFLLVLMLQQGMPLAMPAATLHARYAADWLGIGHQPWNMYAPTPDQQNHRLSAQIMSSNEHVIATWHSPAWRDKSTWQRFWGHRWTEYYDNIWMNHHADLWPALAQHVVRDAKLKYSPDDLPRQVKLIAETKSLSSPSGSRWPAPIPPEDYDDNWVLAIEPLP
ncbi:hypothetical protein NA78x_004605 [Anatilimnocola sp. NA78]|uniref:hypothetical protein n=1 Tax=Anatilimnocola sp. NA78 TaxID=3415683 RepID=UPI003CE4589E